jgi:hypothetical protein
VRQAPGLPLAILAIEVANRDRLGWIIEGIDVDVDTVRI